MTVRSFLTSARSVRILLNPCRSKATLALRPPERIIIIPMLMLASSLLKRDRDARAGKASIFGFRRGRRQPETVRGDSSEAHRHYRGGGVSHGLGTPFSSNPQNPKPQYFNGSLDPKLPASSCQATVPDMEAGLSASHGATLKGERGCDRGCVLGTVSTVILVWIPIILAF